MNWESPHPPPSRGRADVPYRDHFPVPAKRDAKIASPARFAATLFLRLVFSRGELGGFVQKRSDLGVSF